MKGKGIMVIFIIVLILVAIIAYIGGQNLGRWMTTTESAEGGA
ncbi:hypothetical protein GCM10023208_27400 [Erythrobacter westpacificensis]|uniref:Uncharacterized protein n=1 Tax=Erythrobacter westpacificensis TaxID=1055231 RepID=A0ABP9KL79_9SPHN